MLKGKLVITFLIGLSFATVFYVTSYGGRYLGLVSRLARSFLTGPPFPGSLPDPRSVQSGTTLTTAGDAEAEAPKRCGLRLCKVIRGGAISPWGTFLTLYQFVAESIDDGPDIGAVYWHPALVGLSGRGGRARIIDGGERVEITCRDGGKQTIPCSEVRWVLFETEHIVRESGYLFMVDVYPGAADAYKAAERAERGMAPRFTTEDLFLKVSKDLAGTKVIVLEFPGDRDDHKVYTKDGKEIEHQVVRPLSEKIWGERSRSRASSGSNILSTSLP